MRKMQRAVCHCLAASAARACFRASRGQGFVGGAMTEPIKAAGAAFARSSGHTLVYVSDTTARCKRGSRR